MMKLTTPKQPKYNFTRRGNVFYVTSEKNQDEKYMVVQHGQLFLCQCNDFFGRRLPSLGSPDFTLCKHGEFVRQALEAAPGQIIEATKSGKDSPLVTGTAKVSWRSS